MSSNLTTKTTILWKPCRIYLLWPSLWGLYYGMILSVPLSDCLALNYRRKTIASGNNVLNPRTFPHAVWRSPCRHEICRHANRASGDKLFTRSAETEPKWTCFFFPVNSRWNRLLCNWQACPDNAAGWWLTRFVLQQFNAFSQVSFEFDAIFDQNCLSPAEKKSQYINSKQFCNSTAIIRNR